MRWTVLLVLTIVIGLITGLGLSGTGGHVATAASPAGATPVGFSHSVIVDEQWPGFEPDAAIGPDGSIYTSTPQGFTNTISPVWSSRDGGNSYQQVPGNLFAGKQSTCVGGGDTDLYTDAGGELYFSDLQGLTNITTSASPDGGSTWSTNCAGSPNSPVDRMWFAGIGSLAQKNLVLFNEYDAVLSGANPSQPVTNELVESVSTDGTTFQPVVNANTSSLTGDCAGAAVQNCVTTNEGIPGNQVVDPVHSSTSSANVYIAHTTRVGEVGVRVSEGTVHLGTPAMANWSLSPNLAGSLCPGSAVSQVDSSLSCKDASGKNLASLGENFATIAQDQAGYLYVVFTYAPVSGGKQSAPEQIYLSHSLEPAPADPTKTTWSAPQALTGTGVSAGTNTFPWITAGSDGRIDIAYYHADQTDLNGAYGASALTNGEWSVQMLQSLNAHDTTPTFTTTQVTEGPVKYGQICTNGVGCSTGGDRSLGDYLEVRPDATGAAVIAYVFDTSAASSATSAVGPEAISRQLSGPSLYAAAGDVTQGNGPGVPMGSVSDPTGDADYAAMGTRTPASDNLDLTGASLANGTTADGKPALVATIKVKSLAALTTPAAEGGPDGSWLLRWTVIQPGQAGNGHIYYVGMDNNMGAGTATGTSFFAGDQMTQSARPAVLTYPQTTLLTSGARYDPAAGTISITVPLADVGNPPAGTLLQSVTAFTATSALQQGANTLFNQIDATSPFDLVIGAPGTVGAAPIAPASAQTLAAGGTPTTSTMTGTVASTSSSTTTSSATTSTSPPPPSTSPETTPTPAPHPPASRPEGCPAASGTLTPTRLGPLSLGMTRAEARRTLGRYSTRGRQEMDFFCLVPEGIRAAYGYRAELRGLHASRTMDGRIILLLSADPTYAIGRATPGSRFHGVAPGQLIAAVTIGQNRWYVLRDGVGAAVLKVVGGRVEEVGVVDRSLASGARAIRLLFNELI